MDVHVVTSDQDSFKVRFADSASNIDFVVGISIPVVSKWHMQTNQLLSTVTILADEILMNHDHSKPLQREYLFAPDNTKESLEATIEQIRAQPL